MNRSISKWAYGKLNWVFLSRWYNQVYKQLTAYILDYTFTRVSDMNWLTNKKVTKILLWIFLVAVTAIYCINPSNVELFLHTWFHREIIIFDLVRQKNGLPL